MSNFEEQMEHVKQNLDIAIKALKEISRSTVNEIRPNFWIEGKADLITVKSKDAKIASKALAEIGEIEEEDGK